MECNITKMKIRVEISWLPFFNRMVKGVRMEEVSIVSGQTGCGKTFFVPDFPRSRQKEDPSVMGQLLSQKLSFSHKHVVAIFWG